MCDCLALHCFQRKPFHFHTIADLLNQRRHEESVAALQRAVFFPSLYVSLEVPDPASLACPAPLKAKHPDPDCQGICLYRGYPVPELVEHAQALEALPSTHPLSSWLRGAKMFRFRGFKHHADSVTSYCWQDPLVANKQFGLVCPIHSGETGSKP